MGNVIRVTDDTDRRDIELAIEDVCTHARRQAKLIGFHCDSTPWDLDHARINALLTEREARAQREGVA